MPRYINADQMISDVEALRPARSVTIDGIKEYLNDYATADVQEVKHGYWVNAADGTKCKLDEHGEMSPRYCGYIDPICSICGEYLTAAGEYSMPGRYCPYCGAKMDG